MHCLWQCPVISKFWVDVARKLGALFKIFFNKDPELFLLRLPSKDAKGFLLCDKLLLLARKCIMIMWIHAKPPSLSLWFREIFKVLSMERLTAVVRGDCTKFNQIWRPVIDFIPTSLRDIIFKGSFVWDDSHSITKPGAQLVDSDFNSIVEPLVGLRRGDIGR